MRKSPSQSKVSAQQRLACDAHAGDTVSLLDDVEMLDKSTPHTKTANKLAALQMSSPGYTPSPIPLRRRLQQDHPQLQKTLPQAESDMSQDECEVICIDC